MGVSAIADTLTKKPVDQLSLSNVIETEEADVEVYVPARTREGGRAAEKTLTDKPPSPAPAAAEGAYRM